MCEKHLGQCFVLTALHRLPSHSFVFTFCFPSRHFFFPMTVFQREIISQSVLIWLKILVFLFLRNIRNAESIFSFTGFYFFYILQHGIKFSS